MKGSLFIPDGLLPDCKDLNKYQRTYIALRKRLDPDFKERVKKQNRESQKRKRQNNPDFRLKESARLKAYNARKKAEK